VNWINIRKPAVAGTFYPSSPATLAETVDRLLQENAVSGPAPKALIAPHAGFIYSGPVAASIYSLLAAARDSISRVVLLGPSHAVPLDGMAVPRSEAFETPLGTVPLDMEGIEQLLRLPSVNRREDAHCWEHSLEVQLPFLQKALAGFSLLPVVVGMATAEEVAEVLERSWGGEETLIVISSDLSHYHDYEDATDRDSRTCNAILGLRTDISPQQACGCHAVNGLVLAARRHQMRVKAVDLRNSGDTAGPRDRVVGYGAFAFYED
jgi:AmmeMemoRadiSam system protein B